MGRELGCRRDQAYAATGQRSDEFLQRLSYTALSSSICAYHSMAEERKKRASGRTKNLSLLSFGEEAEADEEEAEVAARAAAARRRIRSAHDVLEDERWVGGLQNLSGEGTHRER